MPCHQSRAALLLFVLALSACAGRPQAPVHIVNRGPAMDIATAKGVEQSWWAVRFRHQWPLNAEPDWSIDLLLADRVVRPTLLAQEQDLPRWRFHRRAARTPSGHQFSFIFYADAATANKVFQNIGNARQFTELVDASLLREVVMESVGDAELGATSDPDWPAHLQTHWPAFIMGASALWLELIVECGNPATLPEDLPGKLIYYQGCHEQISGLWRQWGQHAFLHHLSALFGYQPMLIRKDIQF